MRHAIFKKWKDWFLYPDINLMSTWIWFYDIWEELSIEQLLYSIKMWYIDYGNDKIETIEQFDKNYVVLFEITPQ